MRINPTLIKSLRRSRAGFTLIEIVLVLTLLMILIGSAIYMVNQGGFIDAGQETRISGDTKAISTALELYQAKAGRYPTTDQGLLALVEKPAKEPVPERWSPGLDELPADPWNQPYRYRFPAQKSKKPYDVYSIGKDGVDNTEDDLGNWK